MSKEYYRDETLYVVGDYVEYQKRTYLFRGWPLAGGYRELQIAVMGVRPTDRGWVQVNEKN